MSVRARWVACAALVVAFAAFAATRLQVPGLLARSSPVAGAAVAASSLRGPTLPASIQVVGSTENLGGADFGSITVHVGSMSHMVQGTVSPQFQALVPRLGAGDMVKVEIEAGDVKLTSILGSYARLVALAGTDGVLTVDECDALHVSPFSTALEFFVRRELGGDPRSDAQHEATWRKVVSDAPEFSLNAEGVGLEWATVVLARLGSGEVALPPQYANGYELLEDREAVSQFIEQAPEVLEEYAPTLTGIRSMAMTQGALAPAIALLGPVADAATPVFVGAEVLETSGAGFRLHSRLSRKNATFTGGLDSDGHLNLVPDTSIHTERFESVCPSGGYVISRTSLVGQHFRLQRSGKNSDVWMVVSDYEVTYPTCPDYSPYSYQQVWFKSVVELGTATFPRFEARHVLGLRALPYFCASTVPGLPDLYLARCEQALHRFERNGTGTMLELGWKVDDGFQPIAASETLPFSWLLPPRGPLQVQYGDVSIRYWMVEPGNDALRGLVFVAEATDGSDVLSLAGYSAMLDGNAPGGFDTLSPVGTWKYATFEQFITYPEYFDLPPVADVRFVRSNDGRSQYRVITEAGEQVRRVSTWSLVDGRLYDAYVLADGGFYHTCDEAYANGETNCGPWSTRYFRPLKRVGNRLYGIEDLYTNAGSYAQPPPYQIDRVSRPTYYELVAPTP